jgi:hypothetical protein
MKYFLITTVCLSITTVALARTVTKTFSSTVQTGQYISKTEALRESLDLENNILAGNARQITNSTKRNCTVYPYKPTFLRNKVIIQESYINGVESHQGTVFYSYKCKVREGRQ